MKRAKYDLISGVLVLFCLIFLTYYSVNLGKIDLFGNEYYRVYARFDSVSGLKNWANVYIAGVKVGRVINITLNQKSEAASICLEISNRVRLQDDSVASIRTQGLIGNKYVSLTPGESGRTIPPGGTILKTKPSIDFEQLISQFIQGRV